MGLRLLPKPLPQGRCQLFENLFLAGTALRYPHLTAGLYQEAAPVLLPTNVQDNIVFGSIKGNVRTFRLQHSSAILKPAAGSGSIEARFVRPAEQKLIRPAGSPRTTSHLLANKNRLRTAELARRLASALSSRRTWAMEN